MPHRLFVVFLPFVLFVTSSLSITFDLCGLHLVDGITPETHTLARECDLKLERGVRIYWASALILFVVTIGLQLAKSKWVFVSLAALAIAPFILMDTL